jgi:hypothetical protein
MPDLIRRELAGVFLQLAAGLAEISGLELGCSRAAANPAPNARPPPFEMELVAITETSAFKRTDSPRQPSGER